MQFNELRLCMAIKVADLGSGDIVSHERRMEMVREVFSAYLQLFDDSNFPFSIDEVDRCRLNFRKNKDTQMKADVALQHGWRCFWDGRSKGPCCQDAECGHLVPRCKGGDLSLQNCVIECRSHNNQRREMTIEEYIQSEKTTSHLEVVA